VIRDVLGIGERVELGPNELNRRRALRKRLALAGGRANASRNGGKIAPEPLVTGHGCRVDNFSVSMCSWQCTEADLNV
jgi:hypothetical protein